MDAAARGEEAFRRALALQKEFKLEETRSCCEAALRWQPRHAGAHVLLGAISLSSNQPEQARDFSYKALLIDERNIAAHLIHGHAQRRLQNPEAALVSYDRAIAYSPELAVAHLSRAGALQELRRFDAALAGYEKVIALNPKSSEARYLRGQVLSELKLHERALSSYDDALEIDPKYVAAYLSRGDALLRLEKFDAALASYDQAIALEAGNAAAHLGRANVLNRFRDARSARESYRRAMAIDPANAQVRVNLANHHLDFNEADAALQNYAEALSLDPGQALGHLGRAFALLVTGRYAEGWREYEWRWKVPDAPIQSDSRDFPQPRWLGAEAIAGKTVLLHREQGLGDVLQFCRFSSSLAKLGARVILEVHPPLRGLLAGLDGVAQVIERGDALPPFDYWSPLLSLPLVLGTELQSIPCSEGYLSSDPSSFARCRARLGERTRPRVGLVWSGDIRHPNDHNRSIRLADIVPFLPPGIQYVSLQKELRDGDQLTLRSCGLIEDVASELRDFTDTAALCACLDLVITIDSSVAHLGGALGVPTWILLPFRPDWRWLLGRGDSPWYRSVKLYRQHEIGDWSAVLQRMRDDLVGLLTPPPAHGSSR
jgi:tetratricopeptide (TPR) repeat protein